MDRAATELHISARRLRQVLEEHGFAPELLAALSRPLSIRRSDLSGLRRELRQTQRHHGAA